MGVTVIISYYNSSKNEDIESLLMLENIFNSIDNQNGKINTEIIICDDGSYCNKGKFSDNGITILKDGYYPHDMIKSKLKYDYYLYHHSDKYQRAKLWEKAIDISSNENLIFIDDDTPFIFNNSLNRYSEYFKNYSYIKGRVISSNGYYHLFSDNRVQGTNFGITRKLFNEIGGFSDFIYNDSFGDDDDLTYKIYKYITSNSQNTKGCYGGDIIVRNLSVGRWYENIEDKNMRRLKFNKNFFSEHGIKDDKSNKSRQ